MYEKQKSLIEYRGASDTSKCSNSLVKPDFVHELYLIEHGASHIAGVDEVGCGPVAGPIIAAAVILDVKNLPIGLDDSKRLSAKYRAVLYKDILMRALAISVCGLSARTIDRNDIRKCSLEAMRRAVEGLAIRPCHVLIDGCNIPPGLSCRVDAMIKGDQRSISIAAASIIAKVLRDRMMAQAGAVYPDYQLGKHVGYATIVHRKAIEKHGPISGLHRYSFSPLRKRIVGDGNNFVSS
ncbi:MAG: ribonuclease HII [Candidatus Tokpelaia sp. JSC188]|nr:MAG: ribonuclease HII [Candidatus Tokpelaia sp. JSC188]